MIILQSTHEWIFYWIVSGFQKAGGMFSNISGEGMVTVFYVTINEKPW